MKISISNKQNICSALSIILLIICAWFLMPTIKYKPSGMVYSYEKNNFQKTDMNSVTIYRNNNLLPMNAIGKFHAAYYTGLEGNKQNTIQTILEYAKKLASSIGGNGIILTGYGEQDNVLIAEGDILRN